MGLDLPRGSLPADPRKKKIPLRICGNVDTRVRERFGPKSRWDLGNKGRSDLAQNPSQNCFWQLPSLHVCEVYPASPTMAVLQCSHCRVQQLRQSCMQRSSFGVHLGHHKANRSRRAPMELRLPQQLTHTTAAGFTFTSLHESHALARRHGRQNPFWSSLSSSQY